MKVFAPLLHKTMLIRFSLMGTVQSKRLKEKSDQADFWCFCWNDASVRRGRRNIYFYIFILYKRI